MEFLRGWVRTGKVVRLLLVICLALLPLNVAEASMDVVRVGYWQSPNFLEGAGEGQHKFGLGYDYLQEIAAIANWRYEYVYVSSWEEGYQLLKDGKIDLLPGVARTPGRENDIAFSAWPIFTMPIYIFAPTETAAQYGDYTNINGKTIGFVGSECIKKDIESWLQEQGYQANVVICHTPEEADAALKEHRVDLVARRALQVPSDADLVPVAKVTDEDWNIGVNKNRPDLLLDLDQAMNSLWQANPYFVASLSDQYFGNTVLHSQLTTREMQWVQEHPILRVAYLDDYAPFSYTDKKGNAKGLLVDLLNYIKERYHINSQVQYVAYDDYQDLMRAVQNSEVDLAFPTNGDYWDSEQKGSYQSTRVDDVQVNMVYKSSSEITDKTVFAVSRRSPVQIRYMQELYPNNTYRSYANVDECLQAVRDGKADATMINSYESSIKLRNDSELKTEPVDDKVAYCMAVSYQDSPLVSIINRGLTDFGRDNAADSLLKHTEQSYHYTAKDFIYQNKAEVAAIALALLSLIGTLLLLIQNRQHRERIARQIAHTDIMTGLGNRRAYEEMLKHKSKGKLPGTFTCVVVDLNGLKRINDSLGHDAGDEAIIACANCLKRVFAKIRGSELYRTGGDEFVAVYNFDYKTNEQIQGEISDELSKHRGNYLQALSASCGFVMSSDFPEKSIYELIRVADGRMYAEKSSNRLCRI